jgi:hypothetical protein
MKNNNKVEFNDDDSIQITPGLSEDDRWRVWYSRDDFDRFKTEAARDAGVKLFHPNDNSSPSSNSDVQADGQEATIATASKASKFVMFGDFDDKFTEDLSISTDAATCTSRRKCSNEFNDTINDEGEEVCRRGLGFHFSRHRKRHKAWVRASVLAWYKEMSSVLLEKDGSRDVLPRDIVQQLDKERQERSVILLSKLYSKCSKDERQLALSRGKMDHQMAYPENTWDQIQHTNSNESVKSTESDSKKRAVDTDELQTSKRRLTLTDTG